MDNLNYWGQGKDVMINDNTIDGDKSFQSKGRHRILCPIDKFFLVMIRFRLGLLEKDLAYRFGISLSRILITWINFLYLQFQCISPRVNLYIEESVLLSNASVETRSVKL